MKKIRLMLNESLVTNINSNNADIIEDVVAQQKPDYQIIDVTVIPDEEYNPTIQSILIDLDESNKLCESAEESKNLSINILSETVNIKTGYSNSLFEFENNEHTITLSLVLQETERNGIYKVEAYTTKGEKVFESNTYKPKHLIESYLDSLANEYLLEKSLNEAELDDPIKESTPEEVKRDLGTEPGSDEEAQIDELYDLRDLDEWIESLYEEGLNAIEIFNHLTIMNNVLEDYGISEEELENKIDSVVGKAQEGFAVTDFVKSLRLVDEIKNLDIDYSNWNNLSDEERVKLVTPKLTKFYNKYKIEFIKNPDLFTLVTDNLSDDNFHTEVKVLNKLNNKEEE